MRDKRIKVAVPPDVLPIYTTAAGLLGLSRAALIATVLTEASPLLQAVIDSGTGDGKLSEAALTEHLASEIGRLLLLGVRR